MGGWIAFITMAGMWMFLPRERITQWVEIKTGHRRILKCRKCKMRVAFSGEITPELEMRLQEYFDGHSCNNTTKENYT